ncbi:MAG: AAA family ATPase [Candidatus Doudnabacteria bacterium]|nr:AAA family ATPase [Candidatus Doudnabacteria bacterium]
MEWKTVGHNSLKHVFERQLASGIFSQSYLLIGPQGVGKKTLALEFARAIVKAETSQANHPDILLLDQLVEGGAEAVRSALGQISGTPLVSNHRVVIIEGADRLNHHSANALLKTLEEPSSRTIFFLIADTQSVLPTIRSRCQTFACNRLLDSQMADYILKNNLIVSTDLLKIADGSIGTMYELLRDSEEINQIIVQLHSLNTAVQGSYVDKIVALQEFAEVDSDVLKKLFSYWIGQLKRELPINPRAHQTISAVSEAIVKLQQSMNKKLLLQSLLFNA